METKTYCGTIAILGRPNVGKSTLLNRLVGEQISIVSPKPQTTRGRITGVLTDGAIQYIFVDTPGLHKPESKLGDMMVKAVYSAADDVDAAILVSLADKPAGGAELQLLERLHGNGIPVLVALNKTDGCRKDIILKAIASYAGREGVSAIVPVSARTGDGCDALLAEAAKLLPEGEHVFPDDALTDTPERVLASEMVREQLLRMLDKEVPHGLTCQTERFVERDDGTVEIDVLIVCEKDSHKSIIIGKHGSMLKAAGTAARANIEEMLGTKVFLKTWVKVKDDWKNNPAFLAELSAYDGQ